MSDWIQYALLPINTIAAFIAAMVTFRSVLLGGSRIWVNVYSFLISLYALIVYGLATLDFIPENNLPFYIRWFVTAVMVMITLYYVTDRRGKNKWIRRP